MANFDFVRRTFPPLAEGCARAESYAVSDPTAATVWARRVAEGLVLHLYGLLELPAPYRDDLSARINDAAFTSVTGTGIRAKLNLIRRLGNSAAHANRPLRPDEGLTAVRELHHVMVWASFRYSPHPDAVPAASEFDPDAVARAAPLSRDEVRKLAERFRQQDAAHAEALAQRDARLAELDAELAELRDQVASAQAASHAADHHDYGEAETRLRLIDVDLREAGWALDAPRDREFPVTGMPSPSGTGFVDYVLWGADGLPLALVEAKRTGVSPHVGEQQAKLYADCLERQFGRRPVIFYSNGDEHWIWDDASGYPPRRVQGFYTRDELELAVQRRGTRASLAAMPVNTEVAGRPYQQRAIRAVGAAFEARQRAALLTMATGSGKTRTVIALVDLLMKANWAKRVLFLADRTALVRQAAGAFKAQLPHVSTVNLVDNRDGEGRVYVSTYQTMLPLVDASGAGDGDGDATAGSGGGGSGGGGRRFGPGSFDLVVIDEAHRSVYAKYGGLIEWFDALRVGLTATPKNEVDRNTYRLFHLEDGVPTDAYGLDEAVADGYLVPPRAVAVGTRFLRQGIRYTDLSDEEKDAWDALDWGEDEAPDEVGAEELNRFLFNEDTVDKVIATLMGQGRRVAGGDRLGKTIVFAKNQRHAEFVKARFDAIFPEAGGTFAQVVTHASYDPQGAIDAFSDPDRQPHIAISVDMLDTGIDVPEVVNLVFFKLVRSVSKFWQMIGRGTRLRPDLYGPGRDKADFLVFDFCGNVEFFGAGLAGAEAPTAVPLGRRVFEARLALVQALDAAGVEPGVREATARMLHRIVAGMNPGNVLVRPHRRWVRQFSDWEAWSAPLTASAATEIAAHVAGLPSSVSDSDEDAKRFDVLILRRQVAQLDGDAATAGRAQAAVQAVAGALLGLETIPAVAAQAALLEQVAGEEWWDGVTLPMLENARARIRSLVRFVERTRRNPVYSDFEDELGDAVEVPLAQAGVGMDLERFRAKATAYLREHDDHLALQRLRRGRQLTGDDLESLAELLVASGIGSADEVAEAGRRAGGLGLFIRSLVGLDRQAAAEAFARYLDASLFTVEQIRFVQLIVEELTRNGVMEPARLFHPPYTDDDARGPIGLFEDADIDVLVATLGELTARALVPRAA